MRAIRLQRVHRWTLYLILAAVFFSGVAWEFLDRLARGAELPSSWKNRSLQIHGAAAMATLIMLGTLLTTHVRAAWRAGRNRANGIFFLTIFGILTATGYALYYSGGEKLRAWSSGIHAWIGLGLPLFLVIHLWLGRRSRGRGVR